MARDDQTERPTWILSAEHGALGEARAKALLLERFWVLERSIDVHGVDFLIQRLFAGSLEDKEQALRKQASLLSRDFMEWLDDRILAGQ